MTNEQKLLKLITVALQNGWGYFNKLHNLDVISDKIKITHLYNNFYYQGMRVTIEFPDIDYESELTFNNLVCNYEEGEVSFIEALCRATSLTNVDALFVLETLNIQIATEKMRSKWVYLPTLQRLDWLLKTFSHLLE